MQDGSSQEAFEISWIELAFMAHAASAVEYPAFHPIAGTWVNASDMVFRPPLSAAVQVGLLRRALQADFKACDVQVSLLKGCCVAECGLLMRSPGILMGVDVSILQAARSHLSGFASTRPIRTSADLNRRMAV